MKRFMACMAVVTLVCTQWGIVCAAEDAKIIIKMATLAPRDTSTGKAFEELTRQIRVKTGGEVAFKTYWGGVQGDEKDVLRKIRLGQLHGGGFMGPGLGLIVPQVRVTEIPYVFRNYDEVAYVRSKLQPEMEKAFEKEGYIVLGWMNLGFIYTFSKVPLTSLDVARKQKWWTLEGEPIGQAVFAALDIVPISLSISDVATSLSTNMIDCANSTPFGAVAFQWYTKFKYISGYPSSNILGATIVSKKMWDRITPASQKVILEVAHAEHAKIVQATRKDDAGSLVVLKKAGLSVIPLDPEDRDMQYVFVASRKARESLVGRLYSRELLERTLSLVEEYRRAHPDRDARTIRLN